VVRASECQCTSCNGPGFDPSIRRHGGIRGVADEAVLNIVRKQFDIGIIKTVLGIGNMWPYLQGYQHTQYFDTTDILNFNLRFVLQKVLAKKTHDQKK
jgi:hypothetical protein